MARATRHGGRRANELRPVKIETGYVPPADGSCLIELGRTRVICTASFVEGVPGGLLGRGRGGVTAEYGMLPASTGQRRRRPGARTDGRATEIQRLIGRVLRAVVRLEKLGENTIYLDCDVLTAVSAGIVGGKALLDLDYPEDAAPAVDMNVAMTKAGEFVEVQGGSEGAPFDGRQLQAMLRLARGGIRKLIAAQEQAIRKMK